MSKQIGFGILGVLGVICIIGASVFLGLFRGIIDNKIREELPLKEGSDAFKRWKKVDVPIYMKFYILHITNYDKYHNFSDIKWNEKGPYVYEETREKTNITYFGEKNNKTFVSYQEHKVYKFRKDLSGNLTLDDEVYIINVPVLGILFNSVTLGAQIFKLTIPSINDLNEKDLFTKRKVGQIIFDGFEVEFFKKSILGLAMGNKFALFDKGRDSYDEPWSIYTGIDDMDKYGEIYQFDGKSKLEDQKSLIDKTQQLIWPRDVNATHCNKLKGTDGTFFPPKVSDNDVLFAFEPQLCRTVYFHYREKTSVRDIDTYRYWVPEEYFQSPFKNKENECYCIDNDMKKCDWSGILEITNCQRLTKGAPIVMSAPYFFHGDKTIRDLINLENPKNLIDENYGTFLDVEPMTGTVLRATRRIQINIKLSEPPINMSSFDISSIPKYSLLDRQFVVPLLWLEETAEADEKQADDFKSMVTNKLKLGIGIAIAIIVIGVLMTITAIVLFVRHKRSLNKFHGGKDHNRNYK